MPQQPMINSIVLLIISATLAFLAAKYWFERNQVVQEAQRIKEGHDKLMQRVAELERDSALVKAAVVPITTAFQALLIKELTHFHTPVMDKLMEKIGPPNTLTPEEEVQLATLLEERSRDMADAIPESERDAAQILPIVMRRAKVEQDQIEQDSILAVVSVPKTHAEGTVLSPGGTSESSDKAN
jgi:hypothetical protein